MSDRTSTSATPFRLTAALAVVLAVLTACGSGSENRSEPERSVPARTPIGTPTGDAVTATIGAAGGTLESADGALVLDVPPGAITGDEVFCIQPITSHAPGSIGGSAYRLRPEGVTFAQPVRLTFRYADDAILGTAPSLLRLASQDEGGYWRVTEAVTADEASATVAADVSHFSDWSLVTGVLLQPKSARVEVGGTLALQVVVCEHLAQEDELLAPLVAECRSSEFFSRIVRDWSVNGVAGGNGSVGSISKREDGSAVYTAPGTVPASNPVAVSAAYTGVSDGHVVLLIANVLVEEAACGSNPLELCRFDLAKFNGKGLPYDDLPREDWQNHESVTEGQLSLDDFDRNGAGTWAIRYTWVEERTAGDLEHTVQYAGEYEPILDGATLFRALDGSTFQGRIEGRSVQVSGFPFSSQNATLSVNLEFTRGTP